MNHPTIIRVKQFTHDASLTVVALHTALITAMTLSMVMTLPTLG